MPGILATRDMRIRANGNFLFVLFVQPLFFHDPLDCLVAVAPLGPSLLSIDPSVSVVLHGIAELFPWHGEARLVAFVQSLPDCRVERALVALPCLHCGTVPPVEIFSECRKPKIRIALEIFAVWLGQILIIRQCPTAQRSIIFVRQRTQPLGPGRERCITEHREARRGPPNDVAAVAANIDAGCRALCG